MGRPITLVTHLCLLKMIIVLGDLKNCGMEGVMSLAAK